MLHLTNQVVSFLLIMRQSINSLREKNKYQNMFEKEFE